MPNLGPGESLTTGGYVRRADGVVVVPVEAKKLVDATKAMGSVVGMTMAEIGQRVGNCDPIPAVKHSNGYVHTWSQPGYTFGILFGHDNKAVGIADGTEELGGPPTPGLVARQASAPPTRGQGRRGGVKRPIRTVVFALIAIVVLVAIFSHHSGSPSKSSGGSKSQVVLVTRYRAGYANTSCMQLPRSASVRFFIYTHNKGNAPAGFSQNVQALWLDLNATTVDSWRNTMIAPLPKVQPHLYKIIYTDFPASGEQPILKCWIRVGDSTTNIPIHVLPAG